MQLYIVLRKTSILLMLQSMPKGLVLQVKFSFELAASFSVTCLKMVKTHLLLLFFFFNFVFVLKQLMLQHMLIFEAKTIQGSCCGLQGVAQKGLVSDSLC